MGKSWKDDVETFDKESAQKYIDRMKGKKNKDVENWRVGGRYVPSIDCSTLDDEEHFPGQQVAVRILPGMKSNPWPTWLLSIPRFNLREFRKVDETIPYTIDAIYSLNEKLKDQCPFFQLQRDLYEDGSERLAKYAKKLYTRDRHFMNVIVRFLLLEPKDGGKSRLYENVGPRVLELPPTPVEKILGAWKNPKIGSPIKLDQAYDFLYHMVIREAEMEDDGGEGKKKKSPTKFPNYDGCEFDRVRIVAGSDEEIEKWMTSLPNLIEEYKETPMKEQTIIAEKCADVAYGKKPKSTHQVKEDVEHETEDAEIEDKEVESGSPYAGKNKSDNKVEDEDEGPRLRRKPRSDDGDDADEDGKVSDSRMNRRRSRTEDEDEDSKPASRSRVREEEDEEPEPPRSRKRRDEEEDEEPEPARSRKRRDDEEEDEEPEPATRSRKRRDEEEDIEDAEDDPLESEMKAWEEKQKNKKSKRTSDED